MPRIRPNVLSIAGHDPSSGAGLTADLKTFEAIKVYGFSVCSALTFQHESRFQGLTWTPLDQVLASLEILFEQTPINWVKVGIIENLDTLSAILDTLFRLNPSVRVIWDPVFKASAGFTFHQVQTLSHWEPILERIFMVTPNREELAAFVPDLEWEVAAETLSTKVNVFLKGGHFEEQPGKDFLYTEGKRFAFNPREKGIFPKHGSGCVLSAAITGYLAQGYKLHSACLKAKTYTARFLKSNPTLLGYHRL